MSDAPDSASVQSAEGEASHEPLSGGSTGQGGNGGKPVLTFVLPDFDRLLVGLGGAVMALSALMSWLEIGRDAQPNISGIGASTAGAGLVVFLLGLSLLLRNPSATRSLGASLAAFSVALIFIVRIGTDGSLLATGAWLGLIGAALAVVGSLLLLMEPENHPVLSVKPVPAALGSALAVVASFWLAWWPDLYDWDRELLADGLDSDVVVGLPILILGVLALTMLVASVTSGVGGQLAATVGQVSGMVIVALAAVDVIGAIMLAGGSVSSGPLTALAGGIMLARSIREA